MSSSSSGSASFNPDWQTRHDGELAAPMKRRIDALLAASPRTTLASISRAVGLAPQFMDALMRGGEEVRSRRMAAFNAAIERLEKL